jgi:hypothetical protein
MRDDDPGLVIPVTCLIGLTAAVVGLVLLFAMAVPS